MVQFFQKKTEWYEWKIFPQNNHIFPILLSLNNNINLFVINFNIFASHCSSSFFSWVPVFSFHISLFTLSNPKNVHLSPKPNRRQLAIFIHCLGTFYIQSGWNFFSKTISNGNELFVPHAHTHCAYFKTITFLRQFSFPWHTHTERVQVRKTHRPNGKRFVYRVAEFACLLSAP